MINCLDNGKDHRLCEKHWGLVASEDKKTEARARKTVGLPPIEKSTEPINWPTIGDTRTNKQRKDFEEKEGSGCSCRGCKETAVITVRGKHLCDSHWDMWRSRKPERSWRVRELLGLVEDTPPKYEEDVEEPKKQEVEDSVEESVNDIDDFAARLESGEFDM